MNQLEQFKSILADVQKKAAAEIKQAKDAVEAERQRLIDAVTSGKAKPLKGTSFCFAWSADWEVLFEGDVYAVSEVAETISGVVFRRKATKADRLAAKPEKAKGKKR